MKQDTKKALKIGAAVGVPVGLILAYKLFFSSSSPFPRRFGPAPTRDGAVRATPLWYAYWAGQDGAVWWGRVA